MEIDAMVDGKLTKLSHVKSWILVLTVISKRSRGKQLFAGATRGQIRGDLKKIYHRDIKLREIDNILSRLLRQNLIIRERGMIRDGRVTLYRLNPSKTEVEAFNIVKIDDETAIIHNGWEGLIYDPIDVENKAESYLTRKECEICGAQLVFPKDAEDVTCSVCGSVYEVERKDKSIEGLVATIGFVGSLLVTAWGCERALQ